MDGRPPLKGMRVAMVCAPRRDFRFLMLLGALGWGVPACQAILPFDRKSAEVDVGTMSDRGVADSRTDGAPVGARDAEAVDAAAVGDAAAADSRVADAASGPDAGADQAVSDSAVVQLGTWVTIPAGTFMMGSPTDEPCRISTREDLHQVTLTRDFEIESTEVTQGQFEALLGYNPSSFKNCGTICPVEMVNWHEAVAYCNALSAQATLTPCYTCTGSGTSVTCDVAPAYAGANIYTCPGYRLPTEAEWEYAYRAGTQTAYYSGVNDPAACKCEGDANLKPIAWYCGNAGSTTHPVGQKQANAWHLYDMAGNVLEWCHDSYKASLGTGAVSDPWGLASGSTRVLRGGSYSTSAVSARAANRYNSTPTIRYFHYGFRCSRTK